MINIKGPVMRRYLDRGGGLRLLVTITLTAAILAGMLSQATLCVNAAAGTVTLRYGTSITYGSGLAGHTSLKWVTHIDGEAVDLDEIPGVSRSYAYCVQPTADPPSQGTYPVSVVDDDDTGKISKMRKLIYYLPGSYGYAKATKKKWFSDYSNNDAYVIGHLALSWIYDNYSDSYNVWGGAPSSMENKAKSLVEDLGNLPDPPEDYEVFWVKVGGKQDVFGAFYKYEYGRLAVQKRSALPGISEGNAEYELKGAEYRVYTDENCTEVAKTSDGKDAILVIKADGSSDEVELEKGTYYLKETKAPKGYALDVKAHSTEVVKDKTTTFNSQEIPISNLIEVLLNKTDAERGTGKPQGDASLAGAVFRFSYYDGQYSSASAAEGSGAATATWHFKTSADGKISGSSPAKADSYENSDLYRDADGKVTFPLGTYVIQEVKEAPGYKLNTEKKIVNIREDGSGKAHVKSYNEKVSIGENIIRGGVKLAKIDNDLDEAYLQGDASFEGAEFTIYNKSKESVMIGGKEIAKDAIAMVIKTDAAGRASTSADALPYGTYQVKESKSPTGYLPNSEWSATFSIRENGKIVDTTESMVREEVERGGVQIVKRDRELGKSESLGGASLEGITMTIKNMSARDVVVRSDIGSTEGKVDWKKHASKKSLFESGKIKRVKPGEDIGKITIRWNENKKAYTAETLGDDLPYGTYTIRESRTNDSYQRTDKTEHKFEVRKDGTVYSYDNGFESVLSFDDYVYRSDLQGTKIGDGDSKRLSFVPFKISSVTNGETHVIVADKNGFFSTKDRRTGDALDEDEDADNTRKQNPFDDLLNAEEIKKEDLEKRYTDILMGVWFGTGEFGSSAEKNDKFGALPYDSYVIEEIPFDGNEGYSMQKFFFTVDEKSQNGFVDLETITDDVPEIGTQASVDGSNADVSPDKQIVLTDIVEYKNLTKSETYTVKGRLIDKATGEVVKDASGKEIVSETTFKAGSKNGKVKVEFRFDGSNMYGMETVVFETVYDAEGHIVAKHEDIDDEGQTVTWQHLKPSYEMYKIRTTKAPSKGDKYGFFAQDEVEYEVHVVNTGNVVLTMDVSDKFTEGEKYFTKPKLKDVKFDSNGKWNNKGKDDNLANISIHPKEKAIVTYSAVVSDAAREYLAAAAKDSDSLDSAGKDTNMEYQKNKTDDNDGYRNEASCDNVTYPNPDNPDEPFGMDPKKDIAQTPVQKPSIGTTLTDDKGNKEIISSEKTVLVDTVEYRNLDTSKWYVIEGTLMLKESSDPFVENGREITAVSEAFKPRKASGKQKVTFEINTAGLEGKELVAFETAYRLDGYKKDGDDSEVKKTKVAEHRDINDKGQTVKISEPTEYKTPKKTQRKKSPKTEDGMSEDILYCLAAIAASLEALLLTKKRRNDRLN